MEKTNPFRTCVLRLTAATLTVGAIIGAIAVASWPQHIRASATAKQSASASEPPNPQFDIASYNLGAVPKEGSPELVAYGKEIVDHTYRIIGPAAEEPDKRYAGNSLTCKTCHLDSGVKPFAAPYVGVTHRYPNFRSRENRVGSIEQRINGCMERSMNGRSMPEDGREMRAVVAYMEWLSHLTDEKGTVSEKGFVSVKYPDRAVNLAHGERVYTTTCAACHGPDGLGVKLSEGGGYQFPPVAGPDSYNTGAGMHRVLTAMAFIKGNMPLGTTADSPRLTDEEAYDVAGYINSLERPVKANTERDFPDAKLKPMSTPYPPYADTFPQEQHKFGPFQPIHEYYAENHSLDKKK